MLPNFTDEGACHVDVIVPVGGGAFWGAQLKDARRTRRLVAMGERLAGHGGGTITSVFDQSKDSKAAYRLLHQEIVTHETVTASHCAHVREQCPREPWVLLLEDSTTLDFLGRPGCQGLGPIGERWTAGFWLHSTLAVSCEGFNEQGAVNPRVRGLFDQQAWARPPKEPSPPERKAQRLARARESQRWARAFEQVRAPQEEVSRWVYVADRESDIYEVFGRCRGAGVGFVIRANQDRALDEEAQHLFAAAAWGPLLDTREIEIRRPGKPKRTVTLGLRAAAVTLRAPWRPGGKLEPQSVNVVEVCEIDPPAGEEPIHWVLLTDLPIDTVEALWQVVQVYRCRWLIEEFHKALKTGLKVEDSQLRSARKLMALAGLLSVVATLLLDLKLQARVQPPTPLDPREIQPQMLAVLERKQSRPQEGWTAATLLGAVARLGGHQGRRHDGPPGWLTLWRGWQVLQTLVEGYRLAQQQPRCG